MARPGVTATDVRQELVSNARSTPHIRTSGACCTREPPHVTGRLHAAQLTTRYVEYRKELRTIMSTIEERYLELVETMRDLGAALIPAVAVRYEAPPRTRAI